MQVHGHTHCGPPPGRASGGVNSPNPRLYGAVGPSVDPVLGLCHSLAVTSAQTRMDSSPHREVYRLDYGRLENVERTPQGGLRVDAGLTRTGVFIYSTHDGREIREYRPPEEVFHQDSLATLADAPVTDLHPPVMVDPGNFRTYAAGHVAHGTVRQDNTQVAASLVLQEGGLISAVETKARRDVSCGYACLVDETPGIAPDGQRYDRVQRRIRYNHVAIVPQGRAGSAVGLRLDAAGNGLAPGANEGDFPQESTRMFSIRIDGQEYPLGTEAERQAAVTAYNRAQVRQDAQVGSLTAERDTAQGRADAAEGQVRDLTAQLATATDPARLDAMVRDRTELVRVATAHLGAEVKLDGLMDADIRLLVLAKARPEVKLDGKSADYIQGLFQGLEVRQDAQTAVDPDGLGTLRQATAPGLEVRQDGTNPVPPTSDPYDSVAARKRMDATNRTAWTQPLAFSKDAPRN